MTRFHFLYCSDLAGIGVQKKYASLAEELTNLSPHIQVLTHSLKIGQTKYTLPFLMLFRLISLIRLRRKSGQSYMLIRNNIWLSFVPAMFLFAGLTRFLPHLIFDIPTPFFALHNELKYPNFLKTLLLLPAKYLARQSEYTLVYSDDQSPEVLLGTKSHDLRKPSYCLLGNWSTDVSIPNVSQSKSFDRNSLRLVLMARLAPWHGADLLVDAINRLGPQYPITLTILSPQTSTLDQIASRVRELSLKNQLKLMLILQMSCLSNIF